MYEGIEKAYYFDKNEYLLLLGLGSIREIYSFELPKQGDFDHEKLALSLHRLVKRGYVQLQETPVIAPEIERFLDGIRMADWVLHVIPGKEGSQKICYLSDQGAVMTELAGSGGDIRISSVTWQQLWDRLEEGSGMPSMPLETEEEGVQLKSYNDAVSMEYIDFSSRELYPMEEPVLRWLDHEEVLGIWEIVDLNSHKPVRRILFLDGCMNGWIQVQTEQGTELYFDSREFRDHLKQMLESEDEL